MKSESNVAYEANPIASVPEELIALLPGFLYRRNHEAEEILKLLHHRDYYVIAQIAHRLKGNGGGFGLIHISELGRRLEAAAKEGDDRKILSLTRNLTEYVHYLISRMP